MNEHLASVREGDINLNIEVDLTGFTLGSGMSDFITEGRYLLKIADATVEASKKGVGANLKVTFMVEGPPDCSERGKSLVCYHPIPIGANGDAAELKRCFFLRALVAGILDYAGKSGEATKKLHNLPQAWFKGKLVASYVVESMTKPTDVTKEPQPVGEMKSYITKEQYIAAPGPTKSSGAKRVAVGGQTDAPVTQPAAGTASAPVTAPSAPAQNVSDKVADILDF